MTLQYALELGRAADCGEVPPLAVRHAGEIAKNVRGLSARLR